MHNINLDLANHYKMIANDCELTQDFNDRISSIVTKLLDANPLQKEFMNNYKLRFCLAVGENPSIANVENASYPMNRSDVGKGDEFVIVINRDKLEKLDSEDAMAFVLGHEISHIMYEKGLESVRELSTNEEVACDLNSILLLNESGYNLLGMEKVDDLYPARSSEMQMRINERNKFLHFNGIDKYKLQGVDTFWDTKKYAPLLHKKWCLKFPDLEDKSQEEQVMLVVGLMKDVYKYGGRVEFRNDLNDFLDAKSTKESSSFVIKTAEQLTKNFKPIDEASCCDEYRTFLNHPINVFSEVVFKQFSREGGKLFPPEAFVAVHQYAKENPKTFNEKNFCWNKMLKSNSDGKIFSAGIER